MCQYRESCYICHYGEYFGSKHHYPWLVPTFIEIFWTLCHNLSNIWVWVYIENLLLSTIVGSIWLCNIGNIVVFVIIVSILESISL